MEFFKNTNYDFLRWKWFWIVLSMVLSVTGVISLLKNNGPRYGIDFRGGTLVYVKFAQRPDLDRLRSALAQQGLGSSADGIGP